MILGLQSYRPAGLKPAFKNNDTQNSESQKKLNSCLEYKINECYEIYESGINKIKENFKKGSLDTKKLVKYRNEIKNAKSFEEAHAIYAECIPYYNSQFPEFANDGRLLKVINSNSEIADNCVKQFESKQKEILEYKNSIAKNQRENDILTLSVNKAWNKWNFINEFKLSFFIERNIYVTRMNETFRHGAALMDEMRNICYQKQLKEKQFIQEGVLLRSDGFNDPISLN